MPPQHEFLALEVSDDDDIGALSAWLWRRGIAHRVFERRGAQCLIVYRSEQVALVQDSYRELCRGALPDAAPVAPGPDGAGAVAALLGGLRKAPLCAALLALCLAGGALVMLDRSGAWVSQLTFTRPLLEGRLWVFGSLRTTLESGQLWRLLTPIFLHFGMLHLVFNMLWCWEIGRRIEQAQGAGRLLALTVLCGIGGNLAQYLSSSSSLFGGMSGVIYGLLGYTWLWGRLRPPEHFHLPTGIMVVMLVWLLLCASGLVEAVGLGRIANAAHISGLVLGLALAAALASRTGRR